MADQIPLYQNGGQTTRLDTAADGIDAGVNVFVKSPSANPTAVFTAQDNSGTVAFRIIISPAGNDNLFMGEMSAPTTLSGTDNLFIGSDSTQGNDLTSASNNVCLGSGAGRDITEGDNNVFIGVNAGRLGTTGASNVFIGTQAGGLAIVTGTTNVGIGQGALEDITSGSNNFGLGSNAGRNITDGESNTFIGVNAGDAVTSGDQNVGVGTNACGSITTATGNTAIGDAALTNSTGAGNVAIGQNAGDDATSGDENIFIGIDAGNATGQKTDPAGQIVIGRDAFAEADNQCVLGSSAVTLTTLRGTVQVVNSTTAQALHVYNTFTSSTNYERLVLAWDTNVCEIQTEKGSGGGTARALALGTDGTVRTQIGATGVIATGSCFQPGHVVYGYGSGANYTLTNATAEVDEGTDSAIVLDQAGTYKLRGTVELFYSGATYATSDQVRLKLRRTNNTAADITNSAVEHQTFQLTTLTCSIQLSTWTATYTTTNTDDRIALFIHVDTLPSAGSLQVVASHIVAERIA